MNDQARIFVIFCLNCLLAAMGVLLFAIAFLISSHLPTDTYLAVTAVKILSMVIIGYGSTRAWLIFKREVNKKKG